MLVKIYKILIKISKIWSNVCTFSSKCSEFWSKCRKVGSKSRTLWTQNLDQNLEHYKVKFGWNVKNCVQMAYIIIYSFKYSMKFDQNIINFDKNKRYSRVLLTEEWGGGVKTVIILKIYYYIDQKTKKYHRNILYQLNRVEKYLKSTI